MMKILSARFVKSGTAPKHYPPPDLPEVAFAGRSNVGKSSLINALVNRKGLAKTSNTPGRTQALNFFVVNEGWSFTDLPGYGYAKVPESVKRFWGPMVETYLRERQNLRLVILVLDIRRDPNADDLSLLDWLTDYHVPCLPVITKSDKLSKSQAMARRKEICGILRLETAGAILFSARTGEGRDLIWQRIQDASRELVK
jgi:GTP-binding protein